MKLSPNIYIITYMECLDIKNAKLLGEKIRKLRKNTNSSLNSFVLSKGGTTTATWSRVENGKTDVKLSSLIRISAVFGITVSELLDGIEFDYTCEE